MTDAKSGVFVAEVIAGRRPSERPDPVDLLPPLAAARLKTMRAAAADARAALHYHADRLGELREQRRDLERELSRQRQYPSMRRSEDDKVILDLKARIERVAAEIAELMAVHATRTDKAAAASRLVSRAENWLNELPPSSILSDAISAPPVVPKKSNHFDMIEARRRRVRELVADRRRVEAAPVPSAIVKARLAAEIARIAEAGSPDVSGAVEGGELIRWPTATQHIGITGAGVGSLMVPDALAVVAWLHRDELIARLHAEVDAVADDGNALNDAERADQLAQIERDMLAAEREEVALVELAAEQGVPIAHRPEIAVSALLGVVITEGPEDE